MTATDDLITIQNTASESENRSAKSVKEQLTCAAEKGGTGDLWFGGVLKLPGTFENQL